MEDDTIKIQIDFSGGLDLIFNGKNEMILSVKKGSKLGDVIKILGNQHANNKKEMFFIHDKIRPGILVLVNDVDWELADKQQCILETNDKISFISTLHGG